MLRKKNVSRIKKATTTNFRKSLEGYSLFDTFDQLGSNSYGYLFSIYIKITKVKKIIFVLFFLTYFTKTLADTKLNLGFEVYNNKAQCGACHTLKATGSEGDIGPNLDEIKPTKDQIIYVVKNGIGAMPAWEGILTNEEIEAVAYYVFTNIDK